jgi:hypothetical protein
MHWTFDASTLGALIPLFGMLIPIVAIIGGVAQWWHSEAQRHETIRTLARSGQPIPPELLRSGRSNKSDHGSDLSSQGGSDSLKPAMILLAIGISLALALYIVAPESGVWGFGLIPAFLGVAFLLVWIIESRRKI